MNSGSLIKFKPGLLICSVMVFTFGMLFPENCSAAAYQIRTISFQGQRYVYLQDIAAYYGMRSYVWPSRCSIYNRWNNLVFIPDKKSAEINGCKITLTAPPFIRGGSCFINEKDFLLLIDPIIRRYSIIKHPVQVILIDPGHGGKDQGGTGQFYKEKDITLRVAYDLMNDLRAKGFKVYLTRTGDAYIPLETRSRMCKTVKADLFISLHCNIAANRAINGIETFFQAPAGTASTYSTRQVASREPGNYYDKNNACLAYDIHSNLIKKCEAVDRALKHSRFYVVRNATCPAVLVEMGFLSNWHEERKLGTGWYQKIIADAIAGAVLRYKQQMML